MWRESMIKGKNLLIIVLFIFILLIILFIFISGRKSNPLPGVNPVIFYSPEPTSSSQNLSVQVSPPEDASGTKHYPVDQEIKFSFNQEVNWKTIRVTITPEIRTDITMSNPPTDLIIKPAFGAIWAP